jgi:23S rRNA pseudouridine1911/1915/1917 synthase
LWEGGAVPYADIMKETLTIDAASDGKRLDVALAAALGVSRGEAQRIIAGGVALGGKAATAHAIVHAGDVIEYARPGEAAAADVAALPVIFADGDIIVIDKPTGMLMHPTARGERGTVADILSGVFPEISGVGDDARRPGIVHRLDREASGAVVVARNGGAFAALKRQFQDRAVEKEYLVLVDGTLPRDEGDIRLAIGRSARSGRMAARHDEQEGDRPAVTHYRVERRFPKATLAAVKTETGRTHQIRAHFAAIGHPVAGDPLYRAGKRKRVASPRLFLHAGRLAFVHPGTGKKVEFASPLPEDLATFLTML